MGDRYSNIEKIQKVRSEVDSVKGIMGQNIQKVMERGEKVEVLLDKSEKLSHESLLFKRKAKSLKRNMICKNVKLLIVILTVIAIIVIIIIFR